MLGRVDFKFPPLSFGYLLVFSAFLLLSFNALFIEVFQIEDGAQKNITRLVALLLIVASVAFRRPMIDVGLVVAILLLSSAALVVVNFDAVAVVYALLVVVIARSYGYSPTLKALYAVSFIVFLMVFILLALGVTENVVQEFRERHTYGMNGIGGPTLFYNFLFGFLVLGFVYVVKAGKSINRYSLVTLLLAYYFFDKTDVRGGFFAYILVVVSYYFFPLVSRFFLFSSLMAYFPLIFLLMAAAVGVFLNDDYWNILLSNRPSLYADFIEGLGYLEFFLGTSVKAFDLVSIVDNSYIHLYMVGGVFFFAYFCIRFRRCVRMLVDRKDRSNFAFIIGSSAYMFTESLLVRVENPFVIYYWFIVFGGLDTLLRDGSQLDIYVEEFKDFKT
ncbi:hypothetical protein [Spongiibacter tropicus]|uniref:hypothetical protein n=1 Tax=Spongiibacter tropicus TaxID=454602 RepID=UPI00300A3CB6